MSGRRSSLMTLALALAVVAPGAARAQTRGADVASAVPPPPPAQLPIELFDVEGRTHFQFVTRWTPATGTQIWHLDARLALQVIEGLAITLAVPAAVAAPQRDTVDDRFALGNLVLGAAGGTRLSIARGGDGSDTRLAVRLGGAFDVYFPTAPIPDEDRATALLAQHYRPLEPGLWAGRALGLRGRLHVGVGGTAWSVDGELGLTPAFTLASDSDAWLWVTLTVGARVLIAHTFEPFLELGGTLTAAEPTSPRPTADFAAAGFQMIPGVRFHFGSFSPALLVAITPADEYGKITFAVDLAGGRTRTARRADDDMLDGF